MSDRPVYLGGLALAVSDIVLLCFYRCVESDGSTIVAETAPYRTADMINLANDHSQS